MSPQTLKNLQTDQLISIRFIYFQYKPQCAYRTGLILQQNSFVKDNYEA